jgi:hypothetical protein
MPHHNRFLRNSNQLGDASTTFSIGKRISAKLCVEYLQLDLVVKVALTT